MCLFRVCSSWETGDGAVDGRDAEHSSHIALLVSVSETWPFNLREGGASLSAPLTDGGLSHRHASGDPRSLSRTTCLYFESEKTHGEERERRREEKLKERGVNEEGFSKRGSRAWESDDTNQHSGALRQDCGHTH